MLRRWLLMLRKSAVPVQDSANQVMHQRASLMRQATVRQSCSWQQTLCEVLDNESMRVVLVGKA